MNATNLSELDDKSAEDIPCICWSLTTVQVVNIFLKIEKYGGPPLLLFGITCNVLAFLTLHQPKLKESPFIHLKGLTVADLMALVLIFMNLHAVDGSKVWTIFICYVYYPLTCIAATFCVWIMVVMTMERCIFMQFPLWAPIWCTNSSAKFKIIVIALVSFTINFPRFFFYQATPKKTNNQLNVFNNKTHKQEYTIGDNIKGGHFANILAWLYSVVFNFLPVTLLLILNVFLIYKIHAQQKRRNKLCIHNKFEPFRAQEQTRLTITLIAITGLYTILVLPSAFADATIGETIFTKMPYELFLFQHISNFLIWLNLSFNFFMYTFINVKFMRAFKRMCRRWVQSLRECHCLLKIVQPRFNKVDSTKNQSRGARIKSFQLRRYPTCESSRPTCMSFQSIAQNLSK